MDNIAGVELAALNVVVVKDMGQCLKAEGRLRAIKCSFGIIEMVPSESMYREGMTVLFADEGAMKIVEAGGGAHHLLVRPNNILAVAGVTKRCPRRNILLIRVLLAIEGAEP